MQQISYFLQISAMADQRKAPEHQYKVPTHFWNIKFKKDLPLDRALKVCDSAVEDSPILQLLFACQEQ